MESRWTGPGHLTSLPPLPTAWPWRCAVALAQPVAHARSRRSAATAAATAAAVAHEIARQLRERYGSSATADWLDGVGCHTPGAGQSVHP
jgi:hypothetical protein